MVSKILFATRLDFLVIAWKALAFKVKRSLIRKIFFYCIK